MKMNIIENEEGEKEEGQLRNEHGGIKKEFGGK